MSSSELLIVRSRIAAPAAETFAWHTRPGALERLMPPWDPAEVIERRGTLADGGTVTLEVRVGPAHKRWVAVHREYREGEMFRDEQLEGPFARWSHTHRFHPAGPEACEMEDEIEYALPLGALGAAVAGARIQRRLRRMFAYRHQTLASDLERHRAARLERPLRIALTGASGLVGTQLAAFLSTGGHEVYRLVRRAPSDEREIRWDPARGEIDGAALEGMDAVVHLAGENVGEGRWTEERKQRILQSRAQSTQLLAEALARLERPPRVLVSASGINYYGFRSDATYSEDSPLGEGFLATVCQAWEAATEPAARAGIRVVLARMGAVLSPRGGALGKMLPAFRMGVGGPIGSGRQPFSWIALDDALYAIHRALWDETLAGPVNLVAPEAVTNAEFARTLGAVLERPAFLPVPAAAVRLAFGEMGEAIALGGLRVSPTRLRQVKFEFRYPTLAAALRHLLGRPESLPPLAQPRVREQPS